jgi:hypothetical protein
MGTDIYGELCYGLIIDAEELKTLLRDATDDLGEQVSLPAMFEDYVAQKQGLSKPNLWDENKYKNDQEYQIVWDRYWQARRGLLEVVGISLDYYGYEDSLVYMLRINESYERALKFEHTELGQSIVAKPNWQEQLHSFCQLLGVTFTQPQWILYAHISY